jgi:hypothetical protein
MFGLVVQTFQVDELSSADYQMKKQGSVRNRLKKPLILIEIRMNLPVVVQHLAAICFSPLLYLHGTLGDRF